MISRQRLSILVITLLHDLSLNLLILCLFNCFTIFPSFNLLGIQPVIDLIHLQIVNYREPTVLLSQYYTFSPNKTHIDINIIRIFEQSLPAEMTSTWVSHCYLPYSFGFR